MATEPSGHYLHLLRFDGQQHSSFRTNRQTCGNGILDILQGLTLCGPLTDAARDRWTLDDPHSVLVPVNCDDKSHAKGLPSEEGFIRYEAQTNLSAF